MHGVSALVQLRTPPPTKIELPNLPVSLTGYAYTIMKWLHEVHRKYMAKFISQVSKV